MLMQRMNRKKYLLNINIYPVSLLTLRNGVFLAL